MAIENCLIVHLLIVIVQPQRPIFLPDSNNCWWLCWFRIDNPLIVQYVLYVALELLYNGLGMELYDCCTKTCSFTNISKKNIFTLSTFLSSTEHTAFSFLNIFLIFSLWWWVSPNPNLLTSLLLVGVEVLHFHCAYFLLHLC